MTYAPVPPPRPTDVKTCDTTGDQIGRLLLRILNLIWTFALLAGALPLGIVWLIGSVVFMIWLSERRKKRYARNAAALADYQVAMMQFRDQPTFRRYDTREGRFPGDPLPPYPPPAP